MLTTTAVAKIDLSGKVVLANLDRYDVVLHVGQTRREIKPKKASVLAPNSFPVTIEFWSGNTQLKWRKQTIAKAGIYGFNFRRGSWTLTELRKSAAMPNTVRSGTRVVRQTPAGRPSSRAIRQRIVAKPARRLPINADRNRWSPLARAAYAAGTIYQFVRDEQDRDLLRQLLIRAREDEDWDRLERWLDENPIPELYKQELREAFEDLGRLSDADWNEIDIADENDWDQAREDLGDLIGQDEWENIVGDFSEVDQADYWEDNADVDLGDVDFAEDIDFADIEDDVDLGDVDTAVNSIDFGGDYEIAEDYDVGDLGIDEGGYDLGGYDDFGGYDGAFDADIGDFGGGYWGDDDFGDFGGFDDFDFD